MLTEIPVIEIADLRNSDERSIETLGHAFHDIGFCFIRMPEVTAILPRVFNEFRKVFDLSEATKGKYAHPEIFYQRGWTPPFTELALACKGKGLPDAKENWFIGPEFKNNPARQASFNYAENIWPKEVPGFKKVMRELYQALYGCGQDVLRGIGRYMSKPDGYFDEMIKDGPTLLRALHYPPVREDQVGKIIWGCQHTDINLATVLPASTREGLWIRRRDGKWIPGNAPENCVISQVGDMLQYLTAREFISAWHEVRAPNHPTTEGRLSAAIFIHAHPDFIFDPGNPRFPPITASELLFKRLKATGLA